jgi:hypothetical protein
LTLWSNSTRLLNTPIIGPTAKLVASSRIDMVAGLSGELIRSVPPYFCARTVLLAAMPARSPTTDANTRTHRIIAPPIAGLSCLLYLKHWPMSSANWR